MLWSKIQNTDLALAAKGKILSNTFGDFTNPNSDMILHYHNLDHIESMYAFLEKTNEPYDEVLDWAVLFHDSVYDSKPNKELRSALLFSSLVDKNSGCTLEEDDRIRVFQMIMNTEKNERLPCPLVKADLHQLADPVQLFKNFNAIMLESMALYNMDEGEFAYNSELYMRALLDRVRDNLRYHDSFWVKVEQGIMYTIQLAQIIQGK
jgi:predicted metal-dependent HD superfamily phosphohydrolase